MATSEEAAIREAVDQLAAAIIAAVRVRPDPMAPDRLLSVDAACDALGIRRSTLYGELQAGRLRSLKVGRRRLVPSGAIAEYIARESVA